MTMNLRDPFETWERDNVYGADDFEKEEDGTYVNLNIQTDWELWQAAYLRGLDVAIGVANNEWHNTPDEDDMKVRDAQVCHDVAKAIEAKEGELG